MITIVYITTAFRSQAWDLGSVYAQPDDSIFWGMFFQDATFSWFLCIGSLWLWMRAIDWLWSMARYECGTFGVCVDLPCLFRSAPLPWFMCEQGGYSSGSSLNLISYASQSESVEEVGSMETTEWFYMPWAASTADSWESGAHYQPVNHSLCLLFHKKKPCAFFLPP